MYGFLERASRPSRLFEIVAGKNIVVKFKIILTRRKI
jgi:hypothetical protein